MPLPEEQCDAAIWIFSGVCKPEVGQPEVVGGLAVEEDRHGIVICRRVSHASAWSAMANPAGFILIHLAGVAGPSPPPREPIPISDGVARVTPNTKDCPSRKLVRSSQFSNATPPGIGRRDFQYVYLAFMAA